MNELKENSNKRNLKEKIKIFSKNLNKNWVYIYIGGYGTWMICVWSLFFNGIIYDLGRVIFSTILGLAFFLLAYTLKRIRNLKLLKLITGIILVSLGIFGLGGAMWIITSYVLIHAPWTPLRNVVIKGRINLLMLISSYAIGGYIMYRIGKKRKWRPPAHFEIE
ncbi:unnamed protein product [marine sediment metagenome]|uniref:Uncharacterized protein n=1 Tax=marine sediment metagenome TaxID=412755 RepID=X1Q0B4_9ZZZZ